MYDEADKVLLIAFAHTADEARGWANLGHEPIECSFGQKGGSIVGPLKMDHVSIRGHRDVAWERDSFFSPNAPASFRFVLVKRVPVGGNLTLKGGTHSSPRDRTHENVCRVPPRRLK